MDSLVRDVKRRLIAVKVLHKLSFVCQDESRNAFVNVGVVLKKDKVLHCDKAKAFSKVIDNLLMEQFILYINAFKNLCLETLSAVGDDLVCCLLDVFELLIILCLFCHHQGELDAGRTRDELFIFQHPLLLSSFVMGSHMQLDV
eukprot:13969936-Ditylum_brightwellii.AAC.1